MTHNHLPQSQAHKHSATHTLQVLFKAVMQTNINFNEQEDRFKGQAVVRSPCYLYCLLIYIELQIVRGKALVSLSELAFFDPPHIVRRYAHTHRHSIQKQTTLSCSIHFPAVLGDSVSPQVASFWSTTQSTKPPPYLSSRLSKTAPRARTTGASKLCDRRATSTTPLHIAVASSWPTTLSTAPPWPRPQTKSHPGTSRSTQEPSPCTSSFKGQGQSAVRTKCRYELASIP